MGTKRERVGMLAYGTPAQLLWGKQYQWTLNSSLQTITDVSTSTQRQFSYDNLDRLSGAQDIIGASQAPDTTPFAVNSGNAVIGSSGGAMPTPSWTDPDDSNILSNPDTPGAAGWGIENATFSAGVSDPYGTTTAFNFTANSGSNDSYVADTASNTDLYDGETMTGSVWLRSPNGTQNINLYLVEIGTAGYAIPAAKSVTVTTNWQQFQLSGQFSYGHNQLILQIGGDGTNHEWSDDFALGGKARGFRYVRDDDHQFLALFSEVDRIDLGSLGRYGNGQLSRSPGWNQYRFYGYCHQRID
jgi:hypothetical protein